jgi:hypothetical protein
MERAGLQYPRDDRRSGRAAVANQSKMGLKADWPTAELCAGTIENAAFGHFS